MHEIAPSQNQRRTIAANIAWNYAAHFVQIAINIGLTSYLARKVSMAEYGILLFAISLSSTLFLLDFGLSSVLVQEYVLGLFAEGRTELESLLGTVLTATTGLGAVGAICMLALAAIVPGPFHIPREFAHETSLVFVCATGIVFLSFLNLGLEPLYMAAHRFDRLNQIHLTGSLVQLLLTVAVLSEGYGIVALAGIQVATVGLQFVLLIALIPSFLPGLAVSKIRFRWDRLKPILDVSRWAFMNNIAAYLVDGAVWIVLGTFGSMRDAALYGVAIKMPRQLWNLVDRGANVSLPLLTKSAALGDEDGLRRTFLQTQKLVAGAVLPFIVLGCVFAKPVLQLWVGDAYLHAVPVMQWMLLAAFSQAIMYASDLVLYATKHVKKAAIITGLGGAATIGCAVVFVPRMGAEGMALSMAIGQFAFGCVWFTAEACRISRISMTELVVMMTDGLLLPVAILAAGLIPLFFLRARLQPICIVPACVTIGLAYLLVWAFRTAIPLYRREVEITE